MEILTAEVERYRERYGRPGLVAEDVTLLKLLEAKHRREGFEQAVLQTQIRIVEGMLDKGFPWATIEERIGVNPEDLEGFRVELAALQADRGDGAP